MSETILGLDVGTGHIKAVAVSKEKNLNKLVRYALTPAEGLFQKIESERDQDHKKAGETLFSFFKQTNFSFEGVMCVLPENKVFSKVITMPVLGGKQFDEAMKWEAEQHLPQPISEVYLKYSVLIDGVANTVEDIVKKYIPMIAQSSSGSSKSREEEPTMEVLLVAAPKRLIDNFVKVGKYANMRILGLEPASISIIRSCVIHEVNVPTIVVNVGHENIDFSLGIKNSLNFVHSVNLGIGSIIKAIAKELDLSLTLSNEYLLTYGLKSDVLGGKIRAIALPIIDIMLSELAKTRKYVEAKNRYILSLHEHKVRRIILAGGGSLIPDLLLYIAQKFELEVEYADPWKIVDISDIKNKREIEELGPIFAAAAGAAIK